LSLTNAFANNFAYIVVEEKSGKVLASHRADELRPPASLTKKMTLYLIFEALRAGKISLQTKFSISRRATVQEPCKLGLREGQIINVKDIIYALVTRSANDAAIVIAEGLCGSVEKFVSLMNQKAKALGMSYTHFYNTSGLPSYSSSGMLDRSQVTTARDMMILAKALYRDFPKEYSYFKIKQF
jgi:D-alanyl-D-alanine carboxypeptidase